MKIVLFLQKHFSDILSSSGISDKNLATNSEGGKKLKIMNKSVFMVNVEPDQLLAPDNTTATQTAW